MKWRMTDRFRRVNASLLEQAAANPGSLGCYHNDGSGYARKWSYCYPHWQFASYLLHGESFTIDP